MTNRYEKALFLIHNSADEGVNLKEYNIITLVEKLVPQIFLICSFPQSFQLGNSVLLLTEFWYYTYSTDPSSNSVTVQWTCLLMSFYLGKRGKLLSSHDAGSIKR